jgi:glycosyltransferase involved in cell wall biosynthesis
MSENPDYSIVVPVYNSEKSLEELYSRIKTVFESISINYEIIFIDDFSRDGSWNVLENLQKKDSRIKIIHFIRNYGQHNATLSGFNHSRGEYMITLDDDLQNPPEEIPKLLKKIDEGFLVVYGKYPPDHSSLVENLMSTIFQKIIHKILSIPDSIFLSSFAVYKKDIVRNMIAVRSSYPFLFGLMSKSAPINKITNIEVNHVARKEGSSNYGLKKYFKYSLNLIINYSSWPLYIVAILGFLISILSISYGIWIVIQKFFDPSYGIMGWNSLMVAISFLGGSILMALGIIGEYLHRILVEISYGQQYVIGEMKP